MEGSKPTDTGDCQQVGIAFGRVAGVDNNGLTGYSLVHFSSIEKCTHLSCLFQHSEIRYMFRTQSDFVQSAIHFVRCPSDVPRQ